MHCQRTFSFLTCFLYLLFLNIVYAKNIIVKENVKQVHPQILVITDEEFRSLFANEEAISEYITSFWKSVNEIFSQLDKVQVNLHISETLKMNKSSDYDLYSIKDRKSLFKNLVNSTLEFDIAVLMLGDQMDYSQPRNIGFSFGLACDFPNNVVVLNDDGKYRNIYVAVHELAHTFSAKHDNANEETIMSPFSLYAEFNRFSTSSKKKMNRFFNSAKSWCLWNKPSD